MFLLFQLQFLSLHYVPNWLWGGDIGYFESGTRHRFMSGAGLELIFDREIDGNMYIGYEGLDRKLWVRSKCNKFDLIDATIIVHVV